MISQEDYTKSIPERFGMANCEPTRTPGTLHETTTRGVAERRKYQRYQAISDTVMYLLKF